MEEEIQSVTSSEWNLVQRRLDDLESLVTVLKLKLETLGEWNCNRDRSNSYLETLHSDDEETETVIGLNTQSTSAASGIIDVTGQSTTNSEEIVTLAGRDANNTVDSTATSSTGLSFSDGTSINTAAHGHNGIPVSGIVNNKSTLTSTNKESRISPRRRPVLPRKVKGIVNGKCTLTSSNTDSPVSFQQQRPVLQRNGKGVRVEHSSGPLLSHKKQFDCQDCSKRFDQKSLLTKHIRVHRPFQCNICSKKFSHSSNLRVHSRIHTGVMPFQCGVCQKRIRHSSNLKIHLRVHTGDKPFQCNLCPKKFNHLSNSKIHKTVHTGVKAFDCPICSKKFGYRQSLAIHLRSHTGKKPNTPQFCSKKIATNKKLRVRFKVQRKTYRLNRHLSPRNNPLGQSGTTNNTGPPLVFVIPPLTP